MGLDALEVSKWKSVTMPSRLRMPALANRAKRKSYGNAGAPRKREPGQVGQDMGHVDRPGSPAF
jgi:hypothetical protein